jgi:hypothetical protein
MLPAEHSILGIFDVTEVATVSGTPSSFEDQRIQRSISEPKPEPDSPAGQHCRISARPPVVFLLSLSVDVRLVGPFGSACGAVSTTPPQRQLRTVHSHQGAEVVPIKSFDGNVAGSIQHFCINVGRAPSV